MRHEHVLPCITLIVTALLLSGALAETVEHTLTFDQRELLIETRDGFDHIRLGTHLLTNEPGTPALPLVPLQLLLPPGAVVLGVEVTNTQSTQIAVPHRPFPAQPPRILPIPGHVFPTRGTVAPRDDVYGGSEPYPAEIVRLASTTTLGANVVVGVLVHPVQFLPDRGHLRFFKSITLSVAYDVRDAAPGRPEGAGGAARMLASATANPSELNPSGRTLSAGGTRLDPADIEYVIVTGAELAADFQPLADWKTRKGIPAEIVTTDWISAAYTEGDEQARIRAFISDAHDAWGTTWVLLGGDTGVVPTRLTFAMDCEANYQPEDNDIPCDLYYADLDGDWNADGDDVYGELEDGVDLIPDVIVGRASVEHSAEAQAFVAKTLAYERAETSEYQLDMLMAGEILWSDPYTDSGIALNMIDSESVPSRYDPIEKQYESRGNESRESVIASINEGKGHVLHDGHAWHTVLGCGDGYLDRADASALTNATGHPLVYSIGCWPASIDRDCVAERLLENPVGGAVAFIGNSRYGWGSPGNPGYGYSDRFMAEFYRRLFLGGDDRAGVALATAKACFAPLSQSENVYRWHQYELNLLGDPELPVWTDEPAELSIAHPESISSDGAPVRVVVWTDAGAEEGALVCLSNGSDLYERMRTGPDGVVSFQVTTGSPHQVAVTVTQTNCRPYEGLISVGAPGASLAAAGVVYDDSDGNADGEPGPGETVDLSLTLANIGSETAETVTALLSGDDQWVDIVAASTSYGSIDGGTNAEPASPFTIVIDAECPNDHIAMLEATVQSDGPGRSWQIPLPVRVVAPVLSVSSYTVDDLASGDGDGVPEPGESIRLMIEISNDGDAVAFDPEALLTTDDPWAVVVGGQASLASLDPGASRQAIFEILLPPSTPSPSFPGFSLATTTVDGLTDTSAFAISVGTTGFSTDFEGPAIGWSHGGSNDLWKQTDQRAHSGSTSWYCGQEVSWQYANDMAAFLDSPEFVLGEEMQLSFWCWYDVTIYGVDGLYVHLVSNDGSVDTLDFIGSGGALGTLGSIGNEWMEYAYPLAGSTGDTVRVRFLFVSDESDIAEGVYVDDVSVASGVVSTGTDVPSDETARSLIQLDQNNPNPFTLSTTISFSLSTPAPVTLAVYGIQGRLIRTLVSENLGAGRHTISWDGRDESGGDVAAGVYLYRLSSGELEETHKMILVR